MGVSLVILVLILSYIQNEVVELSDRNMNDFLLEHPKTLVMFHADWCGHCKSFMKPYGKLEEALIKGKDGVRVAKVNCSQEKLIAQKYNIKAYPSFKFFNGEEVSNFKRASIPEMINQIKILQRPAYQSFENNQVFEEHRKNNTKQKLWAVLSGKEEDPLTVAFIQLSKRKRQSIVKFITIFSASAAKLKFIKDFDEGEVEYQQRREEGEVNVDQLKKWVDRQSIQLVRRIETKQVTSSLKLNVPVVVVRTENAEQGQLIQKQLEEMKYELNKVDRVLLTYTQDSKTNKHLAEDIGGTYPLLLRVLGREADKNYILSGPPTLDNLQQQLALYREGLLEQFYKSQVEPTSQLSAVVKVVYTSFEREVQDQMREGKDVLVLFHATWCGHCLSLKPVYNKLATQLNKLVPGLVFAMYDAENNYGVYDVEYYPTFVLYSKGKERKMKPSFNRKSFIQWYSKYGAYPLVELEDEKVNRIKKESKQGQQVEANNQSHQEQDDQSEQKEDQKVEL